MRADQTTRSLSPDQLVAEFATHLEQYAGDDPRALIHQHATREADQAAARALEEKRQAARKRRPHVSGRRCPTGRGCD